jgi:hypothetical protein
MGATSLRQNAGGEGGYDGGAGRVLMRRSSGAMYEVNFLIWPALYGYTGWLWGAFLGWPVTGALLAVAAGLVVGALVIAVNPYGVGLFVPWLALALPWFLEADTWRWTALALCAVPLVVVAAGLLLGKRWL